MSFERRQRRQHAPEPHRLELLVREGLERVAGDDDAERAQVTEGVGAAPGGVAEGGATVCVALVRDERVAEVHVRHPPLEHGVVHPEMFTRRFTCLQLDLTQKRTCKRFPFSFCQK